MRKLVLIILICVCCAIGATAQPNQPDITFGNVKPEDFSSSSYAIDSTAEAVFLFDVGSTYFHENGESHFEMVYQRHQRIRILTQNAFDLATFFISLDNTDRKETLSSLDAAVYNLTDGKVVSELVDMKQVFTEKSKEETKVKLTLPKISVGSIIEFSYIIKTPGFELPGWNFQGHYPRLWSRYEVVIPYFFNFAILKQGNLSFVVDSTSTFHTDYSYGHYRMNEVNTLQHTWVMKNVPGIIPEPFTNTIDNYLAKVEFQLSAYADGYGNYTPVNQSWTNIMLRTVHGMAYGTEEEKDHKNLAAIVKSVCAQDTSEFDKARHIYAYVRDNYTCVYHYGKYRTQEVKTILQSKKGTLADINLLLFGLLRQADIAASPVLLSTTDHGKINYEYPTLSRYNYLICQAIINKKQYLLDAGHTYLPFGFLNDKCYNGYSRVISMPSTDGIIISPNALSDSISTSITITKGHDKADVATVFGTQPSIESKAYRRNESRKENSAILKDILSSDALVTDVKAAGFSNADSNVVFTYQIPVELPEEKLIYFSPLLSLQSNANPFAASIRTYQVEMPFCRKDIFHVSMEIPDGYEVEELPKTEIIKADSIPGELVYTSRIENNTIFIDVQSTLGKAIYQPEEYSMLRKFYSDILAKEAQQIVFKKKN